MAIDVMAVDRLRVCTWGRCDLPPHTEMAERMQRIRTGIALKAGQNQWKMPPTRAMMEEAFGPRFRARRRITASTTTNVFAGIETGSNRSVVIKKSASKRWSFMIGREVEILNRLRNPHIVECLESAEDYLVTERLLCAPLDEMGLTNEEVLVVTFDGVEALRHAHQNACILRDLKDEHFLFTPEGKLKLIDLALVRDLRSPRDIVSGYQIVGTTPFIAPEVMWDGSASAERPSDYYSLGVILYFALTGLIIQERSLMIFNDEEKPHKVSYPDTGPIFTSDWSWRVPRVFDPILEGLLERIPEKRLCDPNKTQAMILEALFKKEEPLP